MARRRRPFFAVLAVMAALAVSSAGGAAVAEGRSAKPTPRQLLQKTLHRPGPGGTSQAEEENEGKLLRERAAYTQSITAAPAQVAPASGLRAASAAARSLTSSGGQWREGRGKAVPHQPRPGGPPLRGG